MDDKTDVAPDYGEGLTESGAEVPSSPRDPPGPQPLRPRVTVTGQAVYQSDSGDPTAVGKPFSYACVTDDPPCVRPGFKVGGEWVPVTGLWVETVGLLVISNDGPPRRGVNPTPDEAKADSAAVVEVGVVPPGGNEPTVFSSVHPGQSIRVEPADACLDDYRLRCRSGTARVTLAAFPA